MSVKSSEQNFVSCCFDFLYKRKKKSKNLSSPFRCRVILLVKRHQNLRENLLNQQRPTFFKHFLPQFKKYNLTRTVTGALQNSGIRFTV